MPVAIYNGRKVRIPFDPERIAELIYHHGIDVFPDEDANEVRSEWEKLKINDQLRKLWGDKNVRTKQETVKRRGGSPAIREDAPFSKRIGPKGERAFDIMNVIPNEFIDLPTGTVDTDKLQPFLERLKKIPKMAYGWGLDRVPGKDDISRA